MKHGRTWTVIGLAIAVLAGVAVAIIQANGGIEDPAQLVCDVAARRACDG